MRCVAVIGATGMLGQAVAEHYSRRGDETRRIGRSEYDIAAEPLDKLEPLLRGCDAVINCAGVIKPRIADNTVEDVLKINAIFPRNLARLGDRLGALVFHVTTDCTYSGARGRYTEEDFFDADDLYGLSKNAGDTSDCMVLRTSIIGEERGQSRSLLEWVRTQAGKKVNGFRNHVWNGLTTLHLAELIETILEQSLYEKGVFHVHSPEAVTKYELLGLLNDVYELDLTIHETDAETACDRSLASVRPLCDRLGVKPLRRQIEEMRRFWRGQV